MAIDLIITWEGVDAADYSRRFRTAAHITDFSPALTRIAYEGIAPSIRRNFEEGGRPKWEPLADETVERKIRAGFASPHRILVASGALMESATDPTNYKVDTHTIQAVPTVDYWIYHQRGGGNLPQRVIMNLQVADQRRIGGIFNNFIKDHLARSGLKVFGQQTTVGGGQLIGA